jgi:hypothetical protein
MAAPVTYTFSMRKLTVGLLLIFGINLVAAQSLSERLWLELEKAKSPEVLSDPVKEKLGDADLAFLEGQLGPEKKTEKKAEKEKYNRNLNNNFQEDEVSLGMAAIKRSNTPKRRSRKDVKRLTKKRQPKPWAPRKRSLEKKETPYSQIIHLEPIESTDNGPKSYGHTKSRERSR